MKIVTKNEVEIESNERAGESFTIKIYPSNPPKKVGFLIVFPADCEIEKFSDNSIIIWHNVGEVGNGK